MAQKGALPAFKGRRPVAVQESYIDIYDSSVQKVEGRAPEVREHVSGILTALCETAATFYHRVVLVVGRPGSGKNTLVAGHRNGAWLAALFNLNQRLSELLLELTQRLRALRVPRLVADVLAGTKAPVVLIDNLELLFSPDLALDPSVATRGVARNQTVVAVGLAR